jgi:hypothetical protein
LAALPLYHAMGAQNFMFRQLLTPSTLVVLPDWDVELVMKAFSKLMADFSREKGTNMACFQGTESPTS